MGTTELSQLGIVSGGRTCLRLFKRFFGPVRADEDDANCMDCKLGLWPTSSQSAYAESPLGCSPRVADSAPVESSAFFGQSDNESEASRQAKAVPSIQLHFYCLRLKQALACSYRETLKQLHLAPRTKKTELRLRESGLESFGLHFSEAADIFSGLRLRGHTAEERLCFT